MIEIIKSSYLMYSSLFSCAILLENSCKYFLIKIIYQINLGFLNRLLNMHIMQLMPIMPIIPIIPIIHVPFIYILKLI